ncbi:DUF1441 family protein [Motilimonas cestriensis]|uniref:DUF1441 family protein n=1 Tax=Motilimonas cestriensis TaxID=2742685 RepID=UPI003DA5C908
MSVSSLDDAYNWSIKRIAEAFGLARETVTSRIKKAHVQPAGKKSGHPVYALNDVGPILFISDAAAVNEIHNPEIMHPKDRLDWFKSENERLKFHVNEGGLVEAHDSARAMSDLAKSLIQELETLPDLLERDCGMSPESLDRVVHSIDDLRDRMAQSILSMEE